MRKIIYHEINENSTVETSERRIEPIKALPNPSTVNPGVIFPASISNPAFMIKVNNPRVKILMGSVKKSNTGLIHVFISPITMLATNAVEKS